MVKIEDMMEKLKTKSLSLHGELVAERTAHACALIDNICLQQDKKKAVEEMEEAARLLPAKRTKQKNSAVVE